MTAKPATPIVRERWYAGVTLEGRERWFAGLTLKRFGIVFGICAVNAFRRTITNKQSSLLVSDLRLRTTQAWASSLVLATLSVRCEGRRS